MGVEIKVQMNMPEIREYLHREAQKHLDRTITMLQYVGETVVNGIRTGDISDWNDQTGNLRSSIGYVITVDGQVVNRSNFKKVLGPAADDINAIKEDGSAVGRAYAQEVAGLYPKGIALIVVAGMEYASYVEKRDNKTVLAQGEIKAKTLISKMIQELNAKLETKSK